MYKFLCAAGLHVPRKNMAFSFTDAVSGKPVYRGQCSCGRCWLTDAPGKMFGFKISVEKSSPHHRSNEK